MEVEVSKFGGRETPASEMSEYVVEHVMSLMVAYGIMSIGATRYTSGAGSRLHVNVEPFQGVPQAVWTQGVVAKDAIAQILSVANVTRVLLKPSEKDMKDIRDTWAGAVADADSDNGGSAKASTAGSSAPVKPKAGKGRRKSR